MFDKLKEEIHETWNAVVWRVNSDELIGYGIGFQGQRVENGKVDFYILMQTGTRTTS